MAKPIKPRRFASPTFDSPIHFDDAVVVRMRSVSALEAVGSGALATDVHLVGGQTLRAACPYSEAMERMGWDE